MTPENALLEFTKDFAPELIETVSGLITEPPKTKEEVGFYLSGEESPFELIFRAAVSKFAERKNVWGFEDKYVHEMITTWRDEGIIPKTLPSEITFALEPFAKDSVFAEDDSGDSSPNANIFTTLADAFPKAVVALEDLFAKQSQALLSFSIGSGDTVFFAVVDSEFAAKWTNTKFNNSPLLGIGSADWKLYWNFLGYALGIPAGINPELPQRIWKSV